MKIMKKCPSLVLFSAHNQSMPTTNVIFEWYEKIFDERNKLLCKQQLNSKL